MRSSSDNHIDQICDKLAGDPVADSVDGNRYVIIAGPTASGKSALALQLALRINGVIVNADSMQIYADLCHITARPTPADEAAVLHRLYGIRDGAHRASVAGWLDLVADAFATIRQQGQMPILVGGTGMYINAALNGIASIPDVPANIHQEASDLLHQVGGARFRTMLGEGDPVTAARLFDGDSQRLVRAMGVYRATGRPISAWQQDPHQGMLTGTPLAVAVEPPRDRLYERINARFDEMISKGALEEVEALGARKLDPGLPVMKALGVRELLAYQKGEMDFEAAKMLAKRDSRRYAKRQLTWLRNNFNAQIILNE